VWVLGLIVRVFRIGFWSLTAFLHYVLWLPWLVVVGPGGEGRGLACKRHAAKVFRVCLQNLGATFIKVGQILSTRPDILPAYAIRELRLLQDHVPPCSTRVIRRVLQDDLGTDIEAVFTAFDNTPIASASVAQVHKAQLKDGTVVAVKIRRPNLVRQAGFDEAIMVFGARLFKVLPSVDVLAPVETVREFCYAVRQQMDFRNEADNNREFQANFDGDPDIHFPTLYEQYCSEAVLVMQFVEGVKDDAIDGLGLDRKRLAAIGVRAVLNMVFSHGFVHADLHPGNILFQSDHQVYMIDLGMVGRADERRRNGLAATILALARNDGRTVARFLYEGSPRQDVRNYAEYEAQVCALVAKTQGKSLDELEMSVLIGTIFEILRKNRLRADASFTTINIAMIVMEGLGKSLDPDLDIFQAIQPHLVGVLANAPEAFRTVVTDDMPPPQP